MKQDYYSLEIGRQLLFLICFVVHDDPQAAYSFSSCARGIAHPKVAPREIWMRLQEIPLLSNRSKIPSTNLQATTRQD